MKPKNWDLVKKLQGNFDGNVKQFIVTGGVALNLYGLVEYNDIGDLDIIIIGPTDFLIEQLKNIEKLSPVKNRNEYLAELNKDLIRFELKGVNVDIFIEHELKPELLWFDYVQINPLKHILAAKKKQNRKKDVQFICDLTKAILSI